MCGDQAMKKTHRRGTQSPGKSQDCGSSRALHLWWRTKHELRRAWGRVQGRQRKSKSKGPEWRVGRRTGVRGQLAGPGMLVEWERGAERGSHRTVVQYGGLCRFPE